MTDAVIIQIPRRVEPERHVALLGIKHGADFMAMYGHDGRLICIFDSAREMDVMVPEAPDDQPVTRDDIINAPAIPFGDEKLDGVTYFIGGDVGAIKIGRTVNLDVRLKDIQSCSPIPLRVLATRRGGGREKLYHRLFAAHRLHCEWFDRHPEIMAEIDRLNAPAPRQKVDALAEALRSPSHRAEASHV